MMDITSLGDSERIIIDDERCDKCMNNGKGADECKINKDGKCNFQRKFGLRVCYKCAYATKQYSSAYDANFFVCSIGKDPFYCDSFVPYEHKEVKPVVQRQDAKPTGSLKPCPFCGNTSPVMMTRRGQDGWRDWFYILCDYNNGGCGASGQWNHYPDEAADAWNKRSD